MSRDEKGRFKQGSSGNPNGRLKNGISKHLGWENYSDKEKLRSIKLLAKYGITLSEYNELFEQQGGVCALCGEPETKMQSRAIGSEPTPDSLHVDHCHETGQVRGLLCYRCNTGIGKLRDDPKLLRKAADYIEGKAK